MTLALEASSVANEDGRRKGASALSDRARPTITSSSVETQTVSMYFEASAASIVQAIRGRPHNGSIFFRGSRLLPDRAGISAKNDLLENIDRFRPSVGFAIQCDLLVSSPTADEGFEKPEKLSGRAELQYVPLDVRRPAIGARIFVAEAHFQARLADVKIAVALFEMIDQYM